MKSTFFLKASMLVLLAGFLMASSPVQNSLFAKNTVNSEITKKHKHKHKHSSRKITKGTTGNKTTDNKSGENKGKDSKNAQNNTKTNKK